MKVLVTGAAGFIGSHVIESLAARGHEVIGLDSYDDYLYPAAIKRATASDLARRGVRIVEGDVCNPADVASVVDHSPDVVVHCAALAGVRPSIAQPQRYLRTNVEGTGVLVDTMREAGVRRLVFASSSSVYGAKRGTDIAAFSEEDPCITPASPYAATKRMNELQLSTYRDLFGIGVLALRFFTVYGPRQRPDMAIAKFTRAIATGGPITMFGDGSSRRDYTYIDDVVAGVVTATERVQPAAYELINLGGTQTISLADLIELIERVVGKRAVIERQPDQPGDVPITYADVTKARRLLGYEPTTPPDAGVQRYWDWLRPRL